MAQFPFAHAVEMMYRLMDGVLEVETSIENLSIAAMPVSLGYHPYFQVNDAPRDEWKVTIPARNLVKLTATLVPSGELAANPHSKPVMLKGVTLDDVFTELVRNAAGFAVFSVEGQREKVAVEYGPGYPVAVVYAPPGRGFICFEPMTAVTNAINGAHAGWYKDLPVIGPGEVWRGVYRIRPSGF
jgi:aldose 1-epimerase